MPDTYDYDGTNADLADCLEREKAEVSQIGFALGLLVSDTTKVDGMTHRINSWIDDACTRLRRTPQAT